MQWSLASSAYLQKKTNKKVEQCNKKALCVNGPYNSAKSVF